MSIPWFLDLGYRKGLKEMSEKTICVGKRQTTLLSAIVLVLSGIALVLSGCGAGTPTKHPAIPSAGIRLPSVIGDNMVLQQGGQVPIWGWADPCQKITITASWGGKWEATSDANGNWMVKIKPGKAGGPYEMTISDGNPITLKNILVGEVWVCSGQSNMEFPARQLANPAQETADANNYPQIRMFTVGKKVMYTPMANCQGHWLVCSSRTVVGFSAVGYFFGRDLNKQLNVPIGLIHTSWGGTPAESWMSREYLEGDPDFQPILDLYAKTVANYPELKKKFDLETKQYNEMAAKLRAEGKPVPRSQIYEPIGPNHPYSPTGLYNGMIAPLIPYGIRGAIWYQGESNAWRAYQYRRLFPTMIKCWRDKWQQGDFPFLFVQLANYMEVKSEPTESEWAELREAQLMSLSVPNTGMAVIIDVGEANDIHPKNKQDVGSRLALWTLAKTYGKDVVYSGPLYRSMEIRGNSVILHFESVGGGLIAGKGEPLKGFAIAGQDKKFVWADAKIEGDTIVVSSDKIAEPVAVRYGWADNPVCNLYNKEGLPATPFRTDTWRGITDARR
jgi:sialate O-acetylesterase